MTAVIVFLGIFMYFHFSDEIKKSHNKIKKLEKKMKGESDMSKVIEGLKNVKCRVHTEDAAALVHKTEIEGTVLESDEDWLKLSYTDKDNNKKMCVLRIDNIESIDVIEM